MRIVEFPEQTTVFAKDQPEYIALPAHKYEHDPKGRIVCCWELTQEEIEHISKTRKIWHQILTFNEPLQPQLLTVEKPYMGPEKIFDD